MDNTWLSSPDLGQMDYGVFVGDLLGGLAGSSSLDLLTQKGSILTFCYLRYYTVLKGQKGITCRKPLRQINFICGDTIDFYSLEKTVP